MTGFLGTSREVCPVPYLGVIEYPQWSFSEKPLGGSEITPTCVALLALVRQREHSRRGRGE